jgi:hypothetical protein
MNAKTVIAQAYLEFNKRDIEAALVLMSEDVSWPKASEGGNVIGKQAIRAYWTRQWREFDPRVEPLEISDENAGKIRVRVRQLVKSLDGAILSDGEVIHVFTVRGLLISAMELGDEAERTGLPSAAFARRFI